MKASMTSQWSKWILGAFLALAAQAAWSNTEFRAQAKRDYSFYKEPSDDAALTGHAMKKDERFLVLGTSVGGNWIKLMDKEGNEGWVPLVTVETYRATPENYDEYKYVLDRRNRIETAATINLLAAAGSGPFGFGGELALFLSPMPEGVFDDKIDQLEFGVGFNYYIGPTDINPKQPFFQIPFLGQWLFRFGSKGDFLLGPRVGVAIIKDDYERFGSTLASGYAINFIAGMEGRYYPGEIFGFAGDMQFYTGRRFYVTGSLGFSFRF